MEVVVTTGAIRSCKAPVKPSPPANQHPTSFSQAGCLSCRPTNSVKAMKGELKEQQNIIIFTKTKTPMMSRRDRTRTHWPLGWSLQKQEHSSSWDLRGSAAYRQCGGSSCREQFHSPFLTSMPRAPTLRITNNHSMKSRFIGVPLYSRHYYTPTPAGER